MLEFSSQCCRVFCLLHPSCVLGSGVDGEHRHRATHGLARRTSTSRTRTESAREVIVFPLCQILGALVVSTDQVGLERMVSGLQRCPRVSAFFKHWRQVGRRCV